MKLQVKRKLDNIISAEKRLKELAVEHYGNLQHILSSRRDDALVQVRQKIVKTLRSEGYSYPVIGTVMNRCHTSIIHLDQYKK